MLTGVPLQPAQMLGAACSGPHLWALVPHGLLSWKLLLQLLQVLGAQPRVLGGHSLALQLLLLLLLLLRPLQAEQQVQAGQGRACRRAGLGSRRGGQALREGLVPGRRVGRLGWEAELCRGLARKGSLLAEAQVGGQLVGPGGSGEARGALAAWLGGGGSGARLQLSQPLQHLRT